MSASLIVSASPVPRAGLAALDLYVPGKNKVPVGVKLYKLSSNETPLGPSPLAIEAYKAAADTLELYPDGSANLLREAIAARYGLDVSRLICGAGSDELLSLLAYAYLGAGDEAIYSQYGFLVYRLATLAAGATPIMVPEKEYTADVNAILAAVTPRTKLIFLANPNNPTGTYLPFEEVKRLQAGLPPHVLLVLDAAYAEYVQKNDYAAGIELVSTSRNVVMTRTFSKIHGLANLRIGWLYGTSEIVDVLNRIRGPFNMNGPAIAAGAAAIHDHAHEARAVAHNTLWLTKMREGLCTLGLEVTPSVGNFLLVHFPLGEKNAAAADEFLTQRGIVLRRMEAYGLPSTLRLTIGSAVANEFVLAIMADFMA